MYGASKLYNIMVAKAWNEKLKDTGIEAFSAHPGEYFPSVLVKASKQMYLGPMTWATAWMMSLRENTRTCEVLKNRCCVLATCTVKNALS